MFEIKRIVGDSKCESIAKTEDIKEAMRIADENSYDEEPDEAQKESEDFSWKNYEGFAEIVDDDHDCILYWCNSEGRTGTDLSENDKYYDDIMSHINKR